MAIQDHARNVGDVAAGSITVATVVGWLPAIAAALTVLYTAVRLWESPTFRRIFRALCARCEAWWWDKP